MNDSIPNQTIYFKLIALWVLCEALLGGIIHGLKLPVSGLMIGSCAVLIISLIANYYPVKGAIVKATAVVAIFKMMLSPHSPPPAYIAVFFQGCLGEILFMQRKFFRIACMLLGVLALIESAMQRILVLIIVYGTEFWNAIDIYLNHLSGQEEKISISYYLAVGYISIHLIIGCLIGWLAGKLPYYIERWKTTTAELIIPVVSTKIIIPKKLPKKSITLFVIWLLLTLSYVHALLFPQQSVIPANLPLRIIVRSILIVLTWYFILKPLISALLQNWLKRKKQREEQLIHVVSTLLPLMQQSVQYSWASTSAYKGVKRLVVFCKLLMVHLIYEK